MFLFFFAMFAFCDFFGYLLICGLPRRFPVEKSKTNANITNKIIKQKSAGKVSAAVTVLRFWFLAVVSLAAKVTKGQNRQGEGVVALRTSPQPSFSTFVSVSAKVLHTASCSHPQLPVFVPPQNHNTS